MINFENNINNNELCGKIFPMTINNKQNIFSSNLIKIDKNIKIKDILLRKKLVN
jgi:hypothetical protein